MPALKTLALVVLSLFAVSVGSFGVLVFQSLMADRAATEALLRVSELCQQVADFGGSRTENITVPSGCTMRFVDNLILIDHKQAEVPLPFADNLAPVPAGQHELKVELQANRLVVMWT